MKKIVKIIPLFLVIIAIFILTMQPSSETNALSDVTKDLLVKICGWFGVDTDTAWWNTGDTVRVLAHVIEYFTLGLAAGLALKKKRYALLMCAFLSFADQVTKIFVPNRHFDWRDIPFDMIGYCSGIAIAWVISLGIKALGENRELI